MGLNARPPFFLWRPKDLHSSVALPRKSDRGSASNDGALSLKLIGDVVAHGLVALQWFSTPNCVGITANSQKRVAGPPHFPPAPKAPLPATRLLSTPVGWPRRLDLEDEEPHDFLDGVPIRDSVEPAAPLFPSRLPFPGSLGSSVQPCM